MSRTLATICIELEKLGHSASFLATYSRCLQSNSVFDPERDALVSFDVIIPFLKAEQW
jgi:hypothetical protein